MNAMAANYSVYSNHLRGYEPLFSDNDIYVYCASGNVVVVCLDCCGSSEGQRYEENKHIAPIIFHNGDEPRPSMVWKLSKTLQLMRGRLKVYYADADVYGVLLTEANIVNADDMEDNWETIGIKVIDGFKRLKGRKMKVNNDCEMTEKAYFDVLTGNDSDEMERLLKPNQLERIYLQHAARCVTQKPKDKFNWLIITPEDIVPIETTRQRSKIGF